MVPVISSAIAASFPQDYAQSCKNSLQTCSKHKLKVGCDVVPRKRFGRCIWSQINPVIFFTQIKKDPESCSFSFVCQVTQDQCNEDQDCRPALNECCVRRRAKAYAECIPNDDAFRAATQNSALCSNALVCVSESRPRKTELGCGFLTAALAAAVFLLTASCNK